MFVHSTSDIYPKKISILISRHFNLTLISRCFIYLIHFNVLCESQCELTYNTHTFFSVGRQILWKTSRLLRICLIIECERNILGLVRGQNSVRDIALKW